MAKVPFVGHILSAPPLLNLIMIHFTFIHSGGIKMNLWLTFLTWWWFLYGRVAAERGVSHDIVKSFLLKCFSWTVQLACVSSCLVLALFDCLILQIPFLICQPTPLTHVPKCAKCVVNRRLVVRLLDKRLDARSSSCQPASRLCIRLLDTSCLACKQSKDATHAKSSCRWLLSFPSKLPAPDSNQAVLEARRSLETKGTYRAPTR